MNEFLFKAYDVPLIGEISLRRHDEYFNLDGGKFEIRFLNFR